MPLQAEQEQAAAVAALAVAVPVEAVHSSTMPASARSLTLAWSPRTRLSYACAT